MIPLPLILFFEDKDQKGKFLSRVLLLNSLQENYYFHPELTSHVWFLLTVTRADIPEGAILRIVLLIAL